MVLDRYDEKTYTLPVWQGDTVYHEDVLFYKNRNSARLLYPISEMVSVRSYDLKTEYKEGKDFFIENGLLTLCENTSIPVWEIEPFTKTPSNHVFPVRDSDLFLTETCCIEMRRRSLAVSYKHTGVWEDGYSGKGIGSLRQKLPQIFSKLDSGEELNILLYGDSMSSGWGSSGSYSRDRIFDATNTGSCYETCINVPPYSPAWYDMFVSVLGKMYPKCRINLDNISLGGKGAQWGAQNASARLALTKHRPDIVLIGFGINDSCGGVTPSDFGKYIGEIIDIIRNDKNGNKDACFVPFSCHTCNEDAECYPLSRFLDYEDKMRKMSEKDKNIGYIPLTSLFADMSKSKCALDRLENNINHCMDMGGRIYAQAMIESFK